MCVVGCLKDIITETFAQYNKRLDDSQMRLLLSKDGSANPLWLSLACEELRLFGSFEKVLQKIRELADDLPRLEDERQIGKLMGGQPGMNRQTDRQTDSQSRQAGGQTDVQMDGHR